MPDNLEDLLLKLDETTLSELREIAENEGKELRYLIDEALVEFIENRKQGQPRRSVMAAYHNSHATFAPLYKKLAE